MFVAVLDLASPSWTGGGAYSAMLFQSLRAVAGSKVRLGWMSHQEALPTWAASLNAELLRLPSPEVLTFFPAEAKARQLLGRSLNSSMGVLEREARRLARRICPVRGLALPAAEAAGANVVLPLMEHFGPGTTRVRKVSWIPDLQEVHFPEYFSAAERRDRAARQLGMAQSMDAVMVSSEAVAADVRAHLPAQPKRLWVAPFPSLFAFHAPQGSTPEVLRKYGIPTQYALLANQFWAHKNHAVVVEALELLKTQGVRVPLVMTGLPSDYRDPQNTSLSALLQHLAAANLRQDVWLLGLVTQPVLHGLLRGAAVVLQPSKCEGWSTTVQDARALGRPVVCSDLAVHREQAPDALGFFPMDNAQALAKILSHFKEWPAGPNASAERASLERERGFAMLHGAQLLKHMEALL